MRVDSLDDNFEDKASQSTHLGLSYALGDLTFNMGSLPSQWKREPATCRVVKLADFGTSFFDGADSGQESVGGSGEVGLGSSVDDPRFFTTLENTPIDFLILGTDAKQGYEADTYECSCVCAVMRVHLNTLACVFMQLVPRSLLRTPAHGSPALRRDFGRCSLSRGLGCCHFSVVAQ